MQLDRDGAQHFPNVMAGSDLSEIESQLPPLTGPGTRITSLRRLNRWVGPRGIVGRIAASVLGPSCQPVRAILFDKSETSNWVLGWHQDRTIAVKGQAAVPGFAHWTVKDGTTHVEPPFEIIEGMVTARLHLDAVDDDNAPLAISAGTHRLGRIPEARLATVVAEHGETLCLAAAGDVWLYRTSIVHASAKARTPKQRRVLQLDYAAAELPEPLRWALVA